jgi:hypothetical protein
MFLLNHFFPFWTIVNLQNSYVFWHISYILVYLTKDSELLGIRPTDVRPTDNTVYIVGSKAVGMKLTIPMPRVGLLGNEVSAHGKASVRLISYRPTLANTYNKSYPMGFFTLWKNPGCQKKPSRCEKPFRIFLTFRGFSQREKPYRVGFVICVGEKPLKNPYF